jgi:hypothetical protein
MQLLLMLCVFLCASENFYCSVFSFKLLMVCFLGLNLDGEVGEESKEVCKEKSSGTAPTEEEE